MSGVDYKPLLDDHVLHRLQDTFGSAVAMLIVMSATLASGCPTANLSRDDFHRLVEEICADQRVVDMWGSNGAADQLSQWKRLEV